MSRFKRISLTRALVVAIALAFGSPIVAQLAPCFVSCHDAAMERMRNGEEPGANNALFLLCVEFRCV